MSIAHPARGANLHVADERPFSGDANHMAKAERFTLTMQLAIEKALAHVDDPAHYPLPDDPTAPENVLAARLRQIPPSRRQRMVRAALSVFREQRRRMPLGALACIDLGSREPVLAQIKSILAASSMRFTEDEKQKLLNRIASINGDFGLTYLWAVA